MLVPRHNGSDGVPEVGKATTVSSSCCRPARCHGTAAGLGQLEGRALTGLTAHDRLRPLSASTRGTLSTGRHTAPLWHLEGLRGDTLKKLLNSRETARGHQPSKKERLYCSACRHPITDKTAATPVGGAHQHQFTNPHGISFRIGCYSAAPGCRPVGEATDAHTWFPGYAWRVTLCRGCQQHLGWEFRDPEASRFFGLIMDRLAR